MKRIIAAAAALAALSLASCSEGQADMDEQDRQNQEQETFPEEIVSYLEYFSGTFVGEKEDTKTILEEQYDRFTHEDVVFTPYNSPREVTGINTNTAYGEAVITDWCICDAVSEALSPTSYYCYYWIVCRDDGTIRLYFSQFDSDGLTIDLSMYNVIQEITDESFDMKSYWGGYTGVYLTYIRQ